MGERKGTQVVRAFSCASEYMFYALKKNVDHIFRTVRISLNLFYALVLRSLRVGEGFPDT